MTQLPFLFHSVQIFAIRQPCIPFHAVPFRHFAARVVL